MARKKEKYELNNDIRGILLVTTGVLMVISVFSSESSGILGKFVKKILIAIAGLGAFVFPILIIFIGFCSIAKKNKINFSKKFYGILIFIVNTLLCIQMTIMPTYYINNDINLGIKKIYESDKILHGGIISFLIDIPLLKLFGTVGSYVIFISFYIICFILMSKVSIYEILHTIKYELKNNRIDEDEIIEEKQVSKDVPVESNEQKQSFIKNINNRIKILDFMKAGDKKNDEEIRHIENKKDEDLKDKVPKIEIQCDSDKTVDDSINKELDKQIELSHNAPSIEYKIPPIDLLKPNIQSKLNKEDKRELIANASKLEETLASFGVEAKVNQVSKGPSVTRFELQPSPGVKVSKIVNLSDDIALGLAASGVRIEAPIPGKSAIGIEVPNRELMPVYLREVIESPEFVNSNKNLAYCLGKDIGGNCVASDLSKMPHMLIAGATGSGKSVCINALIISLLYKYSPDNVKLLMIDPKVVELSVYNGIPHLLIPVVTDPKKAAGALNWAVQEMTRRYKLFAENSVRNIGGYNELFQKGKIESKLPFVVIIIDELADLMMVCPNDIEDYIGRLAQMARASGMHLVIATQRPSVDVITGVIKANIPSRISFAVSSQIDSRTILDTTGAEKLLGKGDMLFYPLGESKPIRIQGAFISEGEVEKVVNFIKDQQGEAKYKDEIIDQIDNNSTGNNSEDDELLKEATRIVVDIGQASTSLLQRRLRIGYNRAARIIDQMEERGIISSRDGSKPRQVLINREDL